MKTSRTQFRPLHKMDVHNAHRQMWIEHIAKACFHDGVFLFFFFYADVHMPELSAEGDTVMEGLTLFMIKPYFFSREVCLGGQQRMRRQVWEELLCSYSALHAKQRERVGEQTKQSTISSTLDLLAYFSALWLVVRRFAPRGKWDNSPSPAERLSVFVSLSTFNST